MHHDELQTLLHNLHVDFDVIGISEKIKANFESECSIKIDIPVYKFYSTPSRSEAGGIGKYVKISINSKKRFYLSKSRPDLQTIRIETESTNSKNALCCCAYRHPRANISLFTDHINDIVGKASVGNKLVIIIGDFNISLLNYEHSMNVNNFINCLFPTHFQPVILHRSRIKDTS